MTAPERIRGRRGVGRAGIEPATSCVSSVRTRLSRGAFPGTVIRWLDTPIRAISAV